MTGKKSHLVYIGGLSVLAIVLLGGFAVLRTVFAAGASSTVATTVNVGAATPQITNVKLNGGSSITLTPNATTAIQISYTLTHNNGCSFLNTNTMTSTAWRSGQFSSCGANPTTNPLFCYLYSSRATSSCQSSVTIYATDTIVVYYFAQSTGNSSSSFPSEGWGAFVQVSDTNGATSSATSSYVNVNVLTAINVTTSSINYGSASPSSTVNGSAATAATSTNAGNSSTTLQLYALSTLTSGSNSIATSNQRYSTSTFIYPGTSTALTASAVTVPGFFLTSPTSTSFVQQAVFWGLQVDAGTPTGTYSGTNVFQSLWQP
jgi:hypothetical protein